LFLLRISTEPKNLLSFIFIFSICSPNIISWEMRKWQGHSICEKHNRTTRFMVRQNLTNEGSEYDE